MRTGGLRQERPHQLWHRRQTVGSCSIYNGCRRLHVVDIAPTILGAVGVPEPKVVNGAEQTPMAGVSMDYSFADESAPGTRHTRYFETGGHRALYHDGWVAASFHGAPWVLTGSVGFDDSVWELYNIEEDFSQAHDLAAENPEKLAELQALFDEEARKFDVYPLNDRLASSLLTDSSEEDSGRS